MRRTDKAIIGGSTEVIHEIPLRLVHRLFLPSSYQRLLVPCSADQYLSLACTSTHPVQQLLAAMPSRRLIVSSILLLPPQAQMLSLLPPPCGTTTISQSTELLILRRSSMVAVIRYRISIPQAFTTSTTSCRPSMLSRHMNSMLSVTTLLLMVALFDGSGSRILAQEKCFKHGAE